METRTFTGRSGTSYLVFRSQDGAVHALIEVDAREAALDCGAMEEESAEMMWRHIWS